MTERIYDCLIVDDEPPAREVLRRYIEKMPMLRLAGECSNALQVIAFLQGRPVDLLFLDIRMPQLTGLELVSTLNNPPKIIFTTAFSEFAFQSYELDATDYLLKPIKFERFIKAVNKALAVSTPFPAETPAAAATEKLVSGDGFLYFRADRKMIKVMLKDVLYVESMKDYIKIFTTNGQVITKFAMAALEAMLPAPDFIRIHRSYIIATGHLHSYAADHVQIKDTELPIGRLYQREVLNTLEISSGPR